MWLASASSTGLSPRKSSNNSRADSAATTLPHSSDIRRAFSAATSAPTRSPRPTRARASERAAVASAHGSPTSPNNFCAISAAGSASSAAPRARQIFAKVWTAEAKSGFAPAANSSSAPPTTNSSKSMVADCTARRAASPWFPVPSSPCASSFLSCSSSRVHDGASSTRSLSTSNSRCTFANVVNVRPNSHECEASLSQKPATSSMTCTASSNAPASTNATAAACKASTWPSPSPTASRRSADILKANTASCTAPRCNCHVPEANNASASSPNNATSASFETLPSTAPSAGTTGQASGRTAGVSPPEVPSSHSLCWPAACLRAGGLASRMRPLVTSSGQASTKHLRQDLGG
mmetsp:Transcript_95284/g.238827  ORF Transcript_95284/g.238827 Transcript_95284/m.238827 type:complete len:351 (-) Transcript_95284:2-1054(-)